MEEKRWLVVGGGFTGLAAAYELAQAGKKVSLYEAGLELGGLAGSFSIEGESLEKAYHHFFKTDQDLIGLVQELGVEDLLEWSDSLVAVYRDGQMWPLRGARDLLNFRPCSFLGRLRIGVASLVLKWTRSGEKFEKVSALDWVERWCGPSAVESFWGPLLRGKFGRFAPEVSMAWLWARIHVRTNSRDGGVEQLGYIRGGFVRLVYEIKEKLVSQGVEIHFERRLERIVGDAKSGKVLVSFDQQEESFEKVLFTGPSHSFASLLGDSLKNTEFLQNLAGVRYLAAMCLVFSTTQKLGDAYWVNVNEEESPFLVFIRHTLLVPSSYYGGKEIYYLGAYLPTEGSSFAEDETVLRENWFSYLRKLFPDFDENLVEESHLFRFRNAQHVVGEGYRKKITPYRSPLEGLYLANFSQIYPEDRGTNYAIREGRKVARMMMEEGRSSLR